MANTEGRSGLSVPRAIFCGRLNVVVYGPYTAIYSVSGTGDVARNDSWCYFWTGRGDERTILKQGDTSDSLEELETAFLWCELNRWMDLMAIFQFTDDDWWSSVIR